MVTVGGGLFAVVCGWEGGALGLGSVSGMGMGLGLGSLGLGSEGMSSGEEGKEDIACGMNVNRKSENEIATIGWVRIYVKKLRFCHDLWNYAM